ncbi:MAG: MMPL family transporter [Candidatus Marinimicrobia bacterium]|nr:MMPL family transporter [Candidatus Neomarinimicrobiota bacterium]MCF7830261.1 MMPL family transporter [Candidatus Neomarinimicrobiota bacterium]MCF7882288.1 MMPL family transporter [Candidatus Neomarinimicrobiota bacterium]
MELIRRFVQRYPKSIITITLLLTAFFGYHAFDIGVNTELEQMFPANHPAVETFNQVAEKYGGSEFIVFVVGDENIADVGGLRLIDSLTTAFGEIDGVEQVTSITNVDKIRGEGFTIEVGALVPELPETPEAAAQIRDKIQEHPRYIDSIISKDFRYANILVQLDPDSDQKTVVREMKRIRESTEFPGETYLTGSPVLTEEIADSMQGDIIRLLPFVSIIVMLILFWGFRSKRGVGLPIVIVFISLIFTIGFSGWLGQPLSIVSTALPVLLVSVGSAYAIHFLARFYEDQHEGLGKKKAVSESILNVGLAIVMAGITTAAGFSSLGLSQLRIIRDFGLLTAFGILVALLISITFLPAALLVMRAPKNFRSAENRRGLDSLFDKISDIVHNYSTQVIIIVLVIIGVSAWVIPSIQPETNYITFFPKNSEVRKAHDLVNKEFGGAASLEIVINTGEQNGIENPEFLQDVKNLQMAVDSIDLLENSLSVVDLLAEENQALHENDPAYNRLPESGIAQYLLLLESDDDAILEDFIDFDHQEMRIRVMNGSTRSTVTKNILEKVDGLIAKHFGDRDLDITVTGVPVLGEQLMALILSSQIRSIISAVLFAFIVTSLLLKSARKGLFCSIPIAVTVLVNFGIMGWSTIPLDVATSMIASVAVGIGIDYSIHFYTRFQEEVDKNGDLESALNRAIHTVGRANYFNAFAVTAGFLVLLLSTFPPLRMFGLLSSVTMVLSFLGAMILLPSLIVAYEKVRNTT